MALVEEDAVHDALDRLVNRRVVEDDVRGLAPEFQREFLASAGGGFGDRAADSGGPGEGDLVDIRMIDEGRPGVASSGDDVDNAGRQVGLLQDLGEDKRGQRRGFGRLQHDRVAGGERWGDLPGQHHQREVPRDDLGRDTERARVRAEPGVVELVSPAGVVEEPGCDQRNVDVAALLDRFAVVEALRDGELPRAFLHQPRDAEEVLATVRTAQTRPGTVVGTTGRDNGQVHIFRVGVGDLGDWRLVGR